MAEREDIPFYRLQHFMKEKYGEHWKNYCGHVARFFSFQTKFLITGDYLLEWCERLHPVADDYSLKDIMVFKKLFGFPTIEDFFSFPDQMPEEFKTAGSWPFDETPAEILVINKWKES